MKRKILKSVLCAVLAVVLVVAGYLSYVVLSYSRIEDNQVLTPVASGTDETVQTGKNYTVLTQNIGFGAYTPEFTFFMDGGEKSWAESEESVKMCVNDAIDTIREHNADFMLIQEVDFDSTRSYHIDQRKMLQEAFPGYSSVFAVNYDSAFLMYPFNEPHGASRAGIMTLSRYNVTSAVRRSLPISESFSRSVSISTTLSAISSIFLSSIR